MAVLTICLTILLSIVFMSLLNSLRMDYYRSIDFTDSFTSMEKEQEGIEFIIIESKSNDVIGNLLTMAIFICPIIVLVVVLITFSVVLYNTKLRKPIQELNNGIHNICQRNLEFSIGYCSGDELGKLCQAFELMRSELYLNNKKIWRMYEERLILNKAFSHDIRTPITIIKGHMQVLSKIMENGHEDKELTRQAIDLSIRNIYRIENYVQTMEVANSLMNIEPSYEKVAFEGYIKQLEKDFAHIDKGNVIQWCYVGLGIENVYIDPKLVRRIIENLINNALRFCQNQVEVNCSLEDNALKIQVIDDGEGFTKEAVDMAFLPFYSTDKITHQGLGLYISHLLADRMSGNISIDNRCNGGKICLVIPLLHESFQ